MELLENKMLNDQIDHHKKALQGDDAFSRLDIGAFFQKRIIGFFFEEVRELDLFQIHNSEFINCTFYDVELSGAVFFQTRFINCVFEKSYFIKSDIQQVEFVNCVFDNTNFFGSSLDGIIKNSVFNNCNLDRMYLKGCALENVIFSGDSVSPKLDDNQQKNVIWGIDL